METHVLNGDALAEKFLLEGELIICHEALIEGPVSAKSMNGFWKMRALYLSEGHTQDELRYRNEVKEEFEKLLSYPRNTTLIFGSSTIYSIR
jgi:hypothetical protein